MQIGINAPNYKKLKDWNSGFVEAVLRRHPRNPKDMNGFFGGTITGERGTGKSMYCYKVMAKTYYELNGYSKVSDEEDAYKEALEYMIFDAKTFLKLILRNKAKRIITPIITLDDASTHFGKYLFQRNPKLNEMLLGETATIREAVTGFLINCPKRAHLTKFLREYDDFKGTVYAIKGYGNQKERRWQRKVRFYRRDYLPDEQKFRIHIPFQDKFSCYVPEPFYTWYYEKKRKAGIEHTLKRYGIIPDNDFKEVKEYAIKLAKYLPDDLRKAVDDSCV